MNNFNSYYAGRGLRPYQQHRSTATAISSRGADAGKTIIFLNCKYPTDENFASYDNVWLFLFADQSGDIMGDFVVNTEGSPGSRPQRQRYAGLLMFIGMESHYDPLPPGSFHRDVEAAASRPMRYMKASATTARRRYEYHAVHTDFQRGRYRSVFAANDDMALGAIEA